MCKVVSHCAFNLHFSDDWLHKASFHVYWPAVILFGEVSIQFFAHFFIWIVCYFGVGFSKFFIDFVY